MRDLKMSSRTHFEFKQMGADCDDCGQTASPAFPSFSVVDTKNITVTSDANPRSVLSTAQVQLDNQNGSEFIVQFDDTVTGDLSGLIIGLNTATDAAWASVEELYDPAQLGATVTLSAGDTVATFATSTAQRSVGLSSVIAFDGDLDVTFTITAISGGAILFGLVDTTHSYLTGTYTSASSSIWFNTSVGNVASTGSGIIENLAASLVTGDVVRMVVTGGFLTYHLNGVAATIPVAIPAGYDYRLMLNDNATASSSATITVSTNTIVDTITTRAAHWTPLSMVGGDGDAVPAIEVSNFNKKEVRIVLYANTLTAWYGAIDDPQLALVGSVSMYDLSGPYRWELASTTDWSGAVRTAYRNIEGYKRSPKRSPNSSTRRLG